MHRRLLIVFMLLLMSSVYADISIMQYGSSVVTQSQDLEFITCLDQAHTNVVTSILCEDTLAQHIIAAQAINSSCYYSTVNLLPYTCNSIRAQATYTSDGVAKKITKAIPITKALSTPTLILNSQNWDGGWGSASNTAYAIWVLYAFGDTYKSEIDDGINWLKDNRGAVNKCWFQPWTVSCSAPETIKTLAYLVYSGIDDDKRIISDGLALVESMQHYISDTAWGIEFKTAQSNTTCSIWYDGTLIEDNVSFTSDHPLEYDIAAAYGSLLNFTCDSTVRLNIFDDREISIFDKSFSTTTSVDYDYDEDLSTNDTDDSEYKLVRIKPACFPESFDTFADCDITNTVYALDLPIDSAQITAAKDWVLSTVVNHPVSGYYFDVLNKQMISSIYLKYVDPTNTNIFDWLIYTQNNDGLFGDSNTSQNLLSTTFAIMALTDQAFSSRSEVLSDAKHWVSQQYKDGGYEDVVIDGAMFQVLSLNITPYLLVSNPVDTGSLTYVLTNPTNYMLTDLTYNSTSSSVTVSGASIISAQGTGDLVITPTVSQAGTYGGQVDVIYNKTIIRSVHYSFTNKPSLEANAVKADYNTYDGVINYGINVRSINSQITCTQNWQHPLVSHEKKVTLDSTGTTTVYISTVSVKEGIIKTNGTLSCQVGEEVKVIPLELNAVIHNVPPFVVEPKGVSITKLSSAYPLTITNNFGEDIIVEIKFMDEDPKFTLSTKSISIMPGKSVTVEIAPTFNSSINVTSTNTILVSSLDYTQRVEFDAILLADVANPPSLFIIVFGFVFGVGLLGGGIFFRKDIMAIINKSKDKIHMPTTMGSPLKGMGNRNQTIKSPEKKANATYMLDIISIMRSMDKTDDDIKVKLAAEGYSNLEVANIITQLKEVERRLETIEHEETVLKIIKSIDANTEVIAKVLKEKGFAESVIHEAMAELSKDTMDKEDKLKAEAGIGVNTESAKGGKK